LELLSYIHALVYHERDPAERLGLQEVIEASVRTDERRQEVVAMGKTIANALKEEGRKEGRKEEAVRTRRNVLIMLLRDQFGELPPEVVDAVEATGSVQRLDAWLKRTRTAQTLADMGIAPAR
jgi:hypothetical protein